MVEEIRKYVSENKQEMIDVLSGLVSIPTENPPGNEYKRCLEYLTDILDQWRIDHRVVAVPDSSPPRFSIIGSIGKQGKCLHFHGHYDVVPADRKEQFHPVLDGDRLFGRGSSDMKSGLVLILYALRFLQNRLRGKMGRVTFSLVPDEETGGKLGTGYLSKQGLLPEADLGVLMPEPTSGTVWNGNKGALTLHVILRGKPAHVALAHQGINAFESMLDVVRTFQELKERIENRVTSKKITPAQAAKSVLLLGGRSGSGVNFNVVPESAFFSLDRRFNPEEKLDEVQAEIFEVLNRHKNTGAGLEWEIIQQAESSFCGEQNRLASELKSSAAEILGREPLFQLCPGLCEIRFFIKRGVPAYAFGPGVLDVAHGPQEHVSISNMLDYTAVYILTAERMLSSEAV
jgi:acetylornithine deacetylase/succinyl-diaminopimelate desuccinylase family protein